MVLLGEGAGAAEKKLYRESVAYIFSPAWFVNLKLILFDANSLIIFLIVHLNENMECF